MIEKTLEKKIAREIRRIRFDLDLTQIEFCELFNATDPPHLTLQQALLSAYERCRANPPAVMLEKIRELKNHTN